MRPKPTWDILAGMEDVLRAITERGGIATRAQLLQMASRRSVDATLAEGKLVAIARGRYATESACGVTVDATTSWSPTAGSFSGSRGRT